ncbi:MAG: deoxynucleoside kinase [Pseudomonadales bacterium]|nr:deoxynucleoside kinase [Pseudomonadales bacterium]
MTNNQTETHLLPFDVNPDDLPKFIAIEGPIGVGKTSLAKRMANAFHYESLLENADDNPFLADFYQDQSQNALATQLFFLFQRAQQLKKLHQDDLFNSLYIADFMIEKDGLFAKSTLNPEEFKLYDQVYQQLNIDAPKPDLVLYLQASPQTLIQRINSRGVKAEQTIHADYLTLINEAYSNFFHYYDDAPLLIINAEQVDLINDEQAFVSLVKYMLTIKNGRHYFNPTFFSETL